MEVSWEVSGLRTMLQLCADPPGDIRSHTRASASIDVRKKTLIQFMESYHTISFASDDDFYSARGMCMVAIHITHFTCSNSEQQESLQDLKLSKAASELESVTRATAMYVRLAMCECMYKGNSLLVKQDGPSSE